MPETQIPCTQAKPALLLIEPDAFGSSERAAQLSESEFCVTTAGNPADVYLMRKVFTFAVAVLSDTLGSLALRASAQVVRAQWPRARIVILGRAPRNFDDQLYDESIVHSSNAGTFLEGLKKAAEDPWNLVGHDAYATWLVRASMASRFAQNSVIQESDPTKVPERIREAEKARDWPAIERLRQTVH